MLFQHADLAHHHAAVGGLAHVVDGEQAHLHGGQRLHLDAGAAQGFHLRGAAHFARRLNQLELSKWLLREADESRADSVIAYTRKCVVVPLDTSVALLAADLHYTHKLATADAIVYATAQASGADLLTCDAHFAKLPGCVYFRKRA